MTKRIRYLTLLLVLLIGSTSSWAQEPFNPSDPPEPGQPPMKLEVVVSPAEAGSVSGTGRYVEGAAVNLRAYVNTGFRFISWTNSAGDVLSTSTSYTHTKGAGHEKLTANYVFDPSNPTEPQEPSMIMYYQLQLNATEGGSVSGSGRYLANTNVTLRAYAESKFDFVAWIDDATGDVLSTSTTFNYTTTAKHRSITAQFQFNPDSPAEPSEPILRRTVTATATEGGTTSFSSQYVLIGSSLSFYAYTNSGYDFDGWYLNGELYTKLTSFSYTVTDSYYQNFEARFTFNPSDPSEPGMPTTTKHAIFLMNKVTKPGSTVKYPIYLSSVSTLKDMTFQLEFPEELTPDFTQVEMSEKAEGYSVSYTKEDEKNYIFTLTGGTVPAGNAALLVFTINVSNDIITCLDYPVKINLVEVTEEDNTVTTASTRNGRLSVYKNGDANGDNVVSIIDAVLVANNILGIKVEDFIEEVANVNDDDDINVTDIMGVANIMLGVNPAQSAPARIQTRVLNNDVPDRDVDASNRLYIEDTSLSSGSQAVIPVLFENDEAYGGLQCEVTLPVGITLSDVTKTERLGDDFNLQKNKIDDNTYQILLYNTNRLSFTGNDGALFTMTVEVDDEIAENDYLLSFTNMVVSTVDENQKEPADFISTIHVANIMPGDANGDGTVDIADVTAIINYINGNVSSNFNEVNADVNSDGKIDIADVTGIINIINSK